MSPAATMDRAAAMVLVLGAADDLFYRTGIASVSMAQVRDQSGVSMRRLYSLCPSKTDLVARWLEYRHSTWMTGFRQRVEAKISADKGPAEAIFLALEEWMVETNFRGCGFINSHAESSHLTDEHRDTIRNHKRSLAAYLQTLTPHGFALAILVDGAIVQASIFGDAEPIRLARRTAQTLQPG